MPALALQLSRCLATLLVRTCETEGEKVLRESRGCGMEMAHDIGNWQACNHAAEKRAICGQHDAAHLALWRRRRLMFLGMAACCGAGIERHDSLAPLREKHYCNANPPVMEEAFGAKDWIKHSDGGSCAGIDARTRDEYRGSEAGIIYSCGSRSTIICAGADYRMPFRITPYHFRYCGLRMA